MRTRGFILSAAAAAISAPAFAAAPATLSNAVFHEVEVRAPTGAYETQLAPAAKVMPGDQVVYVLTYKNIGHQPAQGVVVSNPLPDGVEYAGPRDGTPPETSVDGGRTFGALNSLRVPGETGLAEAKLSDVRVLRWVIPGAIPPGGEVRLSYRARLK